MWKLGDNDEEMLIGKWMIITEITDNDKDDRNNEDGDNYSVNW